ncbi:MAG: hypothetical protein FJZ01_25400 [Candidatus Sericytochromatia bacterium]|nr:hypothetical protein [Candidatus Tanganyikabacteria bacterium]
MGATFVAFKGLTEARKAELQRRGTLLDVSSYGRDGWNVLSPRYFHEGIPVPGMDGQTARTVEGIWQGLKVRPDVPGDGTDLAMLNGRPKKRGRPIGHKFGHEVIRDPIEARRKIYLPSFTWMVRNCQAAARKYADLVELARAGEVFLYDRESNGDLLSFKPIAHAAILATMVNCDLAGKPYPW